MPTFKSIHTTYGLECMAAAEATGRPINIIEMAVGDGNGNSVNIDDRADATGLVRERFRAAINRVYADPERNNRYSAELVIPASVGGFTLHEVGIFDDQGGLFAVGNLPETYKPSDGEGAFADTVMRFEFLVTNASAVTVQIDPNVAVATQTWIINNITMSALLPGGTTGQIAKKRTNADGDIEWGDPDDISVTVNTVDEEQALASGQTQVDLATVTTRGLAVYIDGKRLYEGAGVERWQKAPEPDSVTRIILGKSYPAGTRLIAAQTEPTGFAPAPLERSKNLSDLENRAVAQANLDVFSRAETRQMAPPGIVCNFARNSAPTGWLKANGAEVSRVAYAELFAATGTTFGSGNGFTTFNLPDMRGEFVRGWDDGRGVDGGRAFGSKQSGELQSHSHGASAASSGAHTHGGTAQSGGDHSHSATTGSGGRHAHTVTQGTTTFDGGSSSHRAFMSNGNNLGTASTVTSDESSHTHPVSVGSSGRHEHALSISSGGSHAHNISVSASGGAETRPRNIALLACIKY